MTNAEILDAIEVNPAVCAGKPVIRGTRIPVTVILAELAESGSLDDVLRGFPESQRRDVSAAILFAKSYVELTDLTPSATL